MKLLMAVSMLFALVFSQTDSVMTDGLEIESVKMDTVQVIFHYYSQQNFDGEVFLSYAPGYIVTKSVKTESKATPKVEVIHYTKNFARINLNVVYDIKYTRWK